MDFVPTHFSCRDCPSCFLSCLRLFRELDRLLSAQWACAKKRNRKLPYNYRNNTGKLHIVEQIFAFHLPVNHLAVTIFHRCEHLYHHKLRSNKSSTFIAIPQQPLLCRSKRIRHLVCSDVCLKEVHCWTPWDASSVCVHTSFPAHHLILDQAKGVCKPNMRERSVLCRCILVLFKETVCGWIDCSGGNVDGDLITRPGRIRSIRRLWTFCYPGWPQ